MTKSPEFHEMIVEVNIFDTDCYGVMWHGAYMKWLEIGRVKFMEMRGIRLSKPEEVGGHIYPVTEQHLNFLAPARYQDVLRLNTSLQVKRYQLNFYQSFVNVSNDKITMEAETKMVVLDMQWKLQRNLPKHLIDSLKNNEVA